MYINSAVSNYSDNVDIVRYYEQNHLLSLDVYSKPKNVVSITYENDLFWLIILNFVLICLFLRVIEPYIDLRIFLALIPCCL